MFQQAEQNRFSDTCISLKDKMETMKSNLNEKVNNLTEEVQKVNSNFELLKSDFSATRIENTSLKERLIALETQCWANAQYSRWECLEITGILSSVSNKDPEEVVYEAITKAYVPTPKVPKTGSL